MNNTDPEWFSYSNEAKSVQHAFYDAKFILLVEGKDDVPFWNHQFGRYIPDEDFEILRADGKKNYQKDIDGILDGSITNVVAACDADYTDFQDGRPDHPCIVWTYGHSIENTMFCPFSISEFIKTWTSTTTNYQSEIEGWIDSYCTSAGCLLPYEIKNTIDTDHRAEPPKVLKDKYHHLKTSERCSDLDEQKISEHLSSIRDRFNSDDIAEINTRIYTNSKELRHIIQGHFLAAGIMEYIRGKIRSLTGKTGGLSEQVFYMKFSECPRACRSACVDILYLRDQILTVADKFSCTKIS